MPTIDAYGQDISVAALTDAPNAATLAQAIADGLTQRSVMRFASASERSATLTEPVEGMLAWLQDVNLLTLYDGSAWVAVAAGTQAWTTISLASGFSHDGNSNGTAQYRVVNLFGEKTLMLRGGIGVTYSGSPSVIANGGVVTNTPMPSTARPTALRTVTGACSTISSDNLSVKIDIQTDGHIKIIGTTTSTADPKIQPPWISFNGTFCSL